jgi:spermidine synthase
MPRSLLRTAILLFGSGACSLIYETVWLRELRLVFGASTMASAAVVACFVGGLGAGGLLFGPRADAHARPMALYAKLEAGIAASAAISPLLLAGARAAYVAVGGTRVLGTFGGTLARLSLSAFVFALPTVLMGGTLPAVARAVEHEADEGRRDVALLYGANTLGAVTGCMLSTFVLFETFGTRITLFIACLVNALVAVTARSASRTMPDAKPSPVAESAQGPSGRVPPWFALGGAAIAGFVFCLMELVWYRMLTPLLGGTVFTFGLILAMALLGIGLGGIAYGVRPRTAPATMRGFAWTCLLEAACVGLPYALGDRVAVLAALLRPLGGLSFPLQVAGWATVTGLVVAPAAFMSGVQFPLLIGLLGRGETRVARHVGLTYAANTAGAIAGSLAGGFGLMPALTATGCWRLVVWLLLGLGVSALAFEVRRRPAAAIGPALVALGAWLTLRAVGPTSAWRHSPIGAGRVDASSLRSPNGVLAWRAARRSAITWEADGRESSVAIDSADGLAFIVNGKSDGSARDDAGTAVMVGMVGAMLHPHPTHAMVIGLGTGETAGWLAAIEGVTDVDVAELEPAILEVARRSESVNHGALTNPKVHVEQGDARELLLSSKRRYDLIASEPSNPYRTGVASLFTRSYYEAIRSHLEEDGIFLQWLQGYEVDAQTVRTVYATLASVFPEVETWELVNSDLLLVASKKPLDHDAARLRARMAEEPYKSALGFAWRATDLEGFLSHFVAGGGLARRVAEQEGDEINTDDHNIVEFGFARSIVDGRSEFSIEDVRRVARARGEHRPVVSNGEVEWDRVDEARVAFYVSESMKPIDYGDDKPERKHRLASLRAYQEGNLRRAADEWRMQPEEPKGPTELAALGLELAELGDDGAMRYAEVLRSFEATEADAVTAHLLVRQGRLEEATSVLESLFVRLRTDPWPMESLIVSEIADAELLGTMPDPRFAPRLFTALDTPFVLRLLDSRRGAAALAIARHVPGGACASAFASFEPYVPWNEDFLRARYECYHATGSLDVAAAENDLLTFRSMRPLPFRTGLVDGP